MRTERRFRTAESCAVRSAGPAQICPFWSWLITDRGDQLAVHETRPSDRGTLAAMPSHDGRE
jgi:hypothetical protein